MIGIWMPTNQKKVKFNFKAVTAGELMAAKTRLSRLTKVTK